MTSINQSAA